MKRFSKPEVAAVFNTYPSNIRKKLMCLRQLVFDVASETEGAGKVEEALKWGEPGYLVKGGSTIRIDWKSKRPNQYAMYFNCKSKLVDTFKELYSDKFIFEGNRAIVFNETDKIPVEPLKHCIALALTYHRRKNLPLLGV